jgi:hypothetical protein
MAAMGPHSRQLSMQQSTNIICNGSASLKLEKIIFITIKMTTIACRVDDEMRRRRNDDKTTSTAQPAGWIRRCQHRVAGHIGVGNEGGQGGGAVMESLGVLRTLLMVELGSQGFFRRCNVRACTHDNSSKKYGTPPM